jgi:NADH-quinone oxidoreductase subunit L
MSTLLWLIPALPLAGFLVNGLLRLPKAAAGAVGCAGPIASFALSIGAFLEVAKSGPLSQRVAEWFGAGAFRIPFGLRVDELSAVMILVVTGVGSLIHLYSIAYMHDDEGFSRFFAYLNLFMFSMLVLVLGDSAVLLFLGWEGVGLCSYLLIGFWFRELKNADAGKKAFVTNRIGDFGFLIGMFCLYELYGTLDFATMSGVQGWTAGQQGWATAAGLFLFLGAAGKSAQIPLYVWLPDAMAGPTPVSALIHAATMVTAGVYMTARMHFLYGALPGVLSVVSTIAALTAFVAGVIAVAQNDIKKVLAYSTVSQLGFMFAGVGAGDFGNGLFHVVTHAFFKALLFLGAGAVIHALHGEQDIRKMGGLARKLPGLAAVFLVGGLALAGFPFSAGFVSKDAILTSASLHSSGMAYGLLVLTALLTAFYTTRLCVVVFFGKPHGHGEHHEVHKPGLLMMGPLAVLAVLSAVGGKVLEHPLEDWLGRVWAPEAKIRALAADLSAEEGRALRAQQALQAIGHRAEPYLPKGGGPEVVRRVERIRGSILHHEQAHHAMMLLSGGIFVVGAGAALLLYTRAREWLRKQVEGPLRGIHALVSNKFYVDEIYELLILAPIRIGATVLWYLVDRVLIDGLCVHGTAKLLYGLGWVFRRPATGSLNVTAMTFTAGALAILAWAALKWVR